MNLKNKWIIFCGFFCQVWCLTAFVKVAYSFHQKSCGLLRWVPFLKVALDAVTLITLAWLGHVIWRYDTNSFSYVFPSSWELQTSNIKTWTLNKSNLDFGPFDKQLCYCTCLREIFEVNYLRGKYNQRSAAPLMPSIVLCILLWGS